MVNTKFLWKFIFLLPIYVFKYRYKNNFHIGSISILTSYLGTITLIIYTSVILVLVNFRWIPLVWLGLVSAGRGTSKTTHYLYILFYLQLTPLHYTDNSVEPLSTNSTYSTLYHSLLLYQLYTTPVPLKMKRFFHLGCPIKNETFPKIQITLSLLFSFLLYSLFFNSQTTHA